jgi:hypothetical protein
MSRQDGDTPPGLMAAVFGVACTVVVILRPRSVVINAGVAVIVAAAYSLIGLWLCLVLRRFERFGTDDTDDEGWGRRVPEPPGPQPPVDGGDLWPEFERELRAYLRAHERTPSESPERPLVEASEPSAPQVRERASAGG